MFPLTFLTNRPVPKFSRNYCVQSSKKTFQIYLPQILYQSANLVGYGIKVIPNAIFLYSHKFVRFSNAIFTVNWGDFIDFRTITTLKHCLVAFAWFKLQNVTLRGGVEDTRLEAVAYGGFSNGGPRKFRKGENNEDQNKNFSTSPFSCPKSGEDQKKKGVHSDLVRFLAQNWVEAKKKVFAHRLCAQTFCPRYKGGTMPQFCILSNYTIMATQRRGHGPMPPPKYAPGSRPRPRTQKIPGQGQGQIISRPRTQTQVFSKKKVLQKIFSGEKSLQKFFSWRSPLEENKKGPCTFCGWFLAFSNKISTVQKIVLSSSRGQGNFRGLEASRPRCRSSCFIQWRCGKLAWK